MQIKLVAFAPTADIVLTDYVKKQLEAIAISFSGLATEQTNETDPRMQYSWYPDRFPCFIVFVDGMRKAAIHAKLTTPEIIDWVSSNLG